MARVFSIEDGNLTSSITGSRTIDYVDVDLSFDKSTIGDIYKKRDAAAVKQSVKNLILTAFGERPFRPYFGTNLSDLLFELFTPNIKYDIELEIKLAIQNWEPRAKVQSVKVTELREQNSLYVTLVFEVVNTLETVTLNVTLSRLR